VQGSGNWSPPTGTLGRIVDEAKARVAELHRRAAQLEKAADQAEAPRAGFADALRGENVGVIAEVKRRSPSKGSINEGLSAVDQAHAYADGGAAAISVLTEPANFGGSVADLEAVSGDVDIPVLKKDFHIDPIQLLEARAHGASAALLIVRALAPGQLETMLQTAERLGVEALVEVRDQVELRRALDAGARIIGVNNRNLETLVIDQSTSDRILPLIPSSVVAIAESGMAAIEDIQRVAALGADAVLVGSSLSSSSDPESAVRHFASVPRVGRG
jgi:indole-3-glycerol phosphate synthase